MAAADECKMAQRSEEKSESRVPGAINTRRMSQPRRQKGPPSSEAAGRDQQGARCEGEWSGDLNRLLFRGRAEGLNWSLEFKACYFLLPFPCESSICI